MATRPTKVPTHVGRVCNACEVHLERERFSDNQWVNGIGKSRCQTCVEEDHFTPLDAKRTTRTNNASQATYSGVVFAKGSFRNVHKGTYTEGSRSGQPCVVKKFISGSVFEASHFKYDLAVVDKAVEILTQWNQRRHINKQITINIPAVWTETGGTERMLVEPFIAKWQKFNSNTGWAVNGLAWGEALAALSHFSYHLTHGMFLLCDLQGGVYSNGVVLTDPVVLSRTRQFGPTDLGQDGIDNFFGHHKCGQFCSKQWTRPHGARVLMQAKENTTMEHVPTMPGRSRMTAPAFAPISE
jgi:hypothetical protein